MYSPPIIGGFLFMKVKDLLEILSDCSLNADVVMQFHLSKGDDLESVEYIAPESGKFEGLVWLCNDRTGDSTFTIKYLP